MKATQVLLLLVVIAASCGSFVSALSTINARSDVPGGLGSIPGLKCFETLVRLAESPCVPVSLALNAIYNSTSSFSPDALLQKALNSVCKNPTCNTTQITSLQQNFQSGCGNDLDNLIIFAIGEFIDFYAPFTKAACLTNSTGGYCFVETFDNIEETLLSQNVSFDPRSPDQIISNFPSNVVCTSCNKKIINIFLDYAQQNLSYIFGQSDLNNTKEAVAQECGTYFLIGGPNGTSSATTFHSSQPFYVVTGTLLLSMLLSILMPLM